MDVIRSSGAADRLFFGLPARVAFRSGHPGIASRCPRAPAPGWTKDVQVGVAAFDLGHRGFGLDISAAWTVWGGKSSNFVPGLVPSNSPPLRKQFLFRAVVVCCRSPGFAHHGIPLGGPLAADLPICAEVDTLQEGSATRGFSSSRPPRQSQGRFAYPRDQDPEPG